MQKLFGTHRDNCLVNLLGLSNFGVFLGPDVYDVQHPATEVSSKAIIKTTVKPVFTKKTLDFFLI